MFFKQINVTRIGFANDERRATAHAIAVDVIDALRTLENVNDGVVTMVHKVDASFCSEFADAGVIKADNGVVWNADQQQMRWELFTLAEVIKLFGEALQKYPEQSFAQKFSLCNRQKFSGRKIKEGF